MYGENDFVRYNVWHYVRSLHYDTCIQFQALYAILLISIVTEGNKLDDVYPL